MKLRISILALVVAGFAVTATSSALAAREGAATKSVVVAFTGTYKGQASTKVDGNTATITAHGTGKGTLIGAGSINGLGTGDTSQQPCIPFGGTGTIWGSVIGAFLLATIQIGLVLIGVPGSFYVTFIGIMLVIVVIANVRLGRFGSNQA